MAGLGRRRTRPPPRSPPGRQSSMMNPMPHAPMSADLRPQVGADDLSHQHLPAPMSPERPNTGLISPDAGQALLCRYQRVDTFEIVKISSRSTRPHQAQSSSLKDRTGTDRSSPTVLLLAKHDRTKRGQIMDRLSPGCQSANSDPVGVPIVARAAIPLSHTVVAGDPTDQVVTADSERTGLPCYGGEAGGHRLRDLGKNCPTYRR